MKSTLGNNGKMAFDYLGDTATRLLYFTKE
jgi:hypothetical protein